jgi:hypothetical protein
MNFAVLDASSPAMVDLLAVQNLILSRSALCYEDLGEHSSAWRSCGRSSTDKEISKVDEDKMASWARGAEVPSGEGVRYFRFHARQKH